MNSLKINSSVVSCAIFFSCYAYAAESKIGVIIPMTGSQAYYAKETKNGIDLAVSEYMEKNPNSKVKVIYEDNQSSPTEAAKSANKLITSDKVSAIIGDLVSSNTIAAGSIAEKAKIPIVTPTATNDSITVNKKYIYRTCFTDSFQGLVMANFATKNLNKKTAVIIQDIDSDYSIGLSNTFTKKFSDDGGKVLKVVKYSQKDTSYTPQLGDVRKLKPEVVYIPGFHQQVGVILKEAKELKIDAKFLGGDGWDTTDLRKIANGSEKGGFFSTHYSSEIPAPRLKSFITNYKKKFNVEPSGFSVLGYDTAQIIFSAINSTKNGTPEEINNYLANLKDFPGITGNLSMDKNHNAVKAAVIMEFTEKGNKYITNINPMEK
ncbi:ABC transporter substrate-binding protein [Pigmentibacter sp. JX0631]|uniref:ABC transporter substrate-binding protein n=1 Tax=Pigmentibacter sp. JX0631 TaxID=2976982 RepID=UPI0024689DD6|nr:ABC transporter substrate-binding protein [Pigmentibacter sp. JX0631]WGL59142.1 ABC transporter substrate-binding protein [Pigmentibacter sp. JX0631]